MAAPRPLPADNDFAKGWAAQAGWRGCRSIAEGRGRTEERGRDQGAGQRPTSTAGRDRLLKCKLTTKPPCSLRRPS